jgi:hypothetical protein
MEKKTYTIGLAVLVSIIAVAFAIIRANPELYLNRHCSSDIENNEMCKSGIIDTTTVNSLDHSRFGQKQK